MGVSVINGVVTLSGIADTYYKKIEAEEIVKKINGVRAVADDIQVGDSPGARKTDTEIAIAVANALAYHTAVEEHRITVRVEDGIVTLVGTVQWNYQRKAAADAIRTLTGIKVVNNYISISPENRPAGVREMIIAAMERNASIDANNIFVETQEGKVILRGHVRSAAEKEEAECLSWAAPGVTHVEKELTISENGSSR